jgi:hypothetical protein
VLLRRGATALTIAYLLAAPAGARADIGDVLAFPFKWIGGALAGGAADKVKGALDKSVVDVDTRLKQHEYRIAGLADNLVSDTKGKLDDSVERIDHSLEARILQIKTSADDTVGRALSQVDNVAKARLVQLNTVGTNLISEAGSELKKTLDHADSILRERSLDIDRMADDLVSHADAVVEARISQLDEAVGRRLGNVDVIASKQRIALEQGGLRVAVLIALVGFLVFVLRSLWSAYEKALERGELQDVRGARRSLRVAGQLLPSLGRSLLAAGLGAAALVGLYQWLPLGAEHEANELTRVHETGLRTSVARFDYVHARFHASHLEFLKPEETARYGGLADKAGLLRDLIARPSLLATRKAISEFAARVHAVERSLAPRPDPDVLVMLAVVAWNAGPTRADEYRAAALAARALRLTPDGFALMPLARAYIETFLAAPYYPDEIEIGRDAASPAELKEALDAARPDPVESPLGPLVELARAMRTLQRSTVDAYVAMALLNARIVAAAKDHERPAQTLFEQRLARAQTIVHAWVDFDQALQRSHGLESPLVLNVFRLNDAMFTRASWVVEQPQSVEPPKSLHELSASDLALRIRLAPARIAWARRYRDLLNGSVRPVVEFEEAERFRAWESWTIEFEQALIAHLEAKTAQLAEAEARWRVIVAAAALGLYVETGQGPRPFALEFAGGMTAPPLAAAPIAQPPRPTAVSKSTAHTAPRATVSDAPTSLQDALLVRGPRMI